MNSATPPAAPVPQTVDVTGLTPGAVKAIQNLIRAFRGQPMLAAPATSWVLAGPQRGESAEAWFLRFMSGCMTRESVTWFVDDSRESIYEGCGEVHEGGWTESTPEPIFEDDR